MYVICVSLALLGCLSAEAVEKRAFPKAEVIPCDGYENSAVLRVDEVELLPEPAILPGTLDIKISGALMKDMPNLYIKADIYKIFFGGTHKQRIPCISGYGSCVYDVCEMTKPLSQCPDVMANNGIPCQCPFNKFALSNFEETITVDSMPAFIDWLKNGDYEAKAELKESPDGPTLACYIVRASFRSTAMDCTKILNKFKPECKGVIGK